jgi:PAS domain S-box-containing protein
MGGRPGQGSLCWACDASRGTCDRLNQRLPWARRPRRRAVQGRGCTPPTVRGQAGRAPTNQDSRGEGSAVSSSGFEQERLAAIVEHAPTALLLVDEAGTVVLVNAQTQALFGYPRAELLGRPVEQLVPDRARAGHPALRSAYHAAPNARRMGEGRDLYGVRRDGTEVPIEIGLNPIRAGGRTYVLAAIVDITERKRAEDRFRLAVESAPSAMVMVDASGTILLVNALTERLFGWPREQLLGRSVEMLVPDRFRAQHPASRGAFLADPRTRPMGADRELFALRRDGAEVPVEIGLNPIHSPEGTWVLAAVVDITERRHAQEALQRRNEEVEAFVYTVSHDLRTPLVNLQGFSRELQLASDDLRSVLREAQLDEATRTRVDAILDEDIAGALRFIRASTSKFERLILALLGLSRSGRREFHEESLDVAAVVTTTLDELHNSVEGARAVVTVGPLPRAWGDATAVGQVFANLITNALQYLDPARPGRIEIGGASLARQSHYWVRDNGLGIAESAKPRLFQVFQRFRPDRAPGEGMGLAIIKRIVDRHGGKVWAESSEGVGTTFHVTLPADRPPEGTA